MLSLQISVQNGAVLCGKSGGNVRGKEGHTIQWTSDRDFTLEFFRTPEEGEECDPVKLDGWPFAKPASAQDVKWPVKTFEGVLKEGYGLFKYSITVGNLRLDPIIIVDRIR